MAPLRRWFGFGKPKDKKKNAEEVTPVSNGKLTDEQTYAKITVDTCTPPFVINRKKIAIIDSVIIDIKEQMLTCHASQREWLQAHHGIDQYVIAMKEWSAVRGRQIGAEYGEGFGQYLAHAYPRDNIIQDLLS